MSWRGPSLPLTRLTPAACSDAELRAGVRELLLARWRELLDPSWLQVARGWVDRGEESLVVVGTPGEPPGEGPAERLDLLVQVGGPAPRALAEHWLARALADDGGAPLRRLLEARGYALAADAALPSVDAARFVGGASGRLGLVTADGVEWQDARPALARDPDLSPAERAAAAWVRAGGPCACGPCAAVERAAPWRSALAAGGAGPGGAGSRTELSLAGDELLVREVGVAAGVPFDRTSRGRLVGAVPGLGVALVASERGVLVLDLRARRLLLEPTTVTERVTTSRAPGAGVDAWVADALGVRRALGCAPPPAPPLAWTAPQPWRATGPTHERVTARAGGADVVLVRDPASGPVALRVRASGPPSFEVAWKAEAPGVVVVEAAVAPGQLGALRLALRAAFASDPALEAEARQLAALEAWASAAPLAAAPGPAAAPPRPAATRARSRDELLGAIAAAAADVGSELSGVDHGAGSLERVAALDREVREAVDALPDLDRAELAPLAARGVTSAWSELEARARARLVVADAAPGPSGQPGAAAEAARLREAIGASPPGPKHALASAWLRVAYHEALAGDLEGARRAFDQALDAHGNTARSALRGAPLNAWRVELAPAAFRSKLGKALAPHADALAATLVSTTRLSAVPGGAGDGPTSRLLGSPSLPPGEPWPAGPDGAPMRFLLQVDLAAAPPSPPLPRRGLLLVFLVDGPGLGHGLHERAVRVLHVAEPPATARAAPTPRAPLGEPCGLAFDAEVEPAAPPDAAFARRCPSVASDRAAVRALAKAYPLAGTKLGGYAFFTQEDPRARDAARADHVQLLQLDEVPAARLTLGDGGVGHVFAPAGDLARLDFSRAWWHWDSR